MRCDGVRGHIHTHIHTHIHIYIYSHPYRHGTHNYPGIDISGYRCRRLRLNVILEMSRTHGKMKWNERKATAVYQFVLFFFRFGLGAGTGSGALMVHSWKRFRFGQPAITYPFIKLGNQEQPMLPWQRGPDKARVRVSR